MGQEHGKSFERIRSWGQTKTKNKNNKLIDKLTRKATFLTFLIPRINTRGGMRTRLVSSEITGSDWVRARDSVLVAAVDGAAQARESCAKVCGANRADGKIKGRHAHWDPKYLRFLVSCSVSTQSKSPRNTEPNESHPAVKMQWHPERPTPSPHPRLP